jgi:hypothetical protein
MCQHPFPFELLTRAGAQDERVSLPVLDGGLSPGGAASRPAPTRLLFVLVTALVLLVAVLASPFFG